MTEPARRTSDVSTWNPFRELDELRGRVSQLLESSFGQRAAGGLDLWSPPVDIEESDDAFLIEAELPGVKREHVTAELSDNELWIHGEVKVRERVGILRRQTRRTGEFDYRVRLPGDVDPDSIEATLTEGILQLKIRKSARTQPRRIEITTG
ncbi:MAG: Hsp20/alpha crystallin family protein [Actinomycetota bacterium]|nr:Hsp20/alpha crystallin family protein [Actinomycetota bacterium]